MKCKVKVSGGTLWRGGTKSSLALSLIFGFILQCQAASSNQDEVVFYEDPKFDGNKLFITLGKGCYTMESDWDNRISSVDPKGNCIMAYEKADCRGTVVKLTEGSTGLDNLDRLQFDNAITSIRTCTSGSNGDMGIARHNDMNGPEIWRVGIEEHNRYRRLHGVPPLHGDRHLHDEAQEHADYLAKNNKFEVSPQTKYGENLATSYAKDKLEAIREVVKRWYDKIEYFSFRNPDANRDRPKSAQFSNVIWQASTHMGIGIAKNSQDNKWVVVVFYDPAATRSKYKENVPPPIKQLNAEHPVMFRTSALSNFFDRTRPYEYFV